VLLDMQGFVVTNTSNALRTDFDVDSIAAPANVPGITATCVLVLGLIAVPALGHALRRQKMLTDSATNQQGGTATSCLPRI
jgi:hypothetical protein